MKKEKKKKNLQPRVLYLAKLSLRKEGEMNTFLDKQKLREFITTRPSLQEMLKGGLHAEKMRISNMKTYDHIFTTRC